MKNVIFKEYDGEIIMIMKWLSKNVVALYFRFEEDVSIRAGNHRMNLMDWLIIIANTLT